MSNIKIIGDIHGKVDAYYQLIKDVPFSIQLGDFGFRHSWKWLEQNKINSDNHKIIVGNHDEYPYINKYIFPDYGMVNFHGLDFYTIRGAFSVDKAYRTQGISWWPEEELSYNDLQKAIDDYTNSRPYIVISHECPGDHTGISTSMFQRRWIINRTGLAMQKMWNNYHPKLWIFGHWHRTMIYSIEGTTFVCLDELDSINYEINDNIGNDINWNIVNIRNQIKKIKNRYTY